MMNYVKIRCNPYTKHIEYYYKDEYENWVPASSKLSSDEFNNITIQHKLYDIIREIQNTYNLGNKGLELIFEGTEDDYNDVCMALSYFQNYRIKCKKGMSSIDTAKDTMPIITEIFTQLGKIFKEYPDDEIAKEIAKFSETIKPTVVVCVMGLYSSGKSAFINSLIGTELLPSASDPTTAKNYKIITSLEAKIKFQYNQEMIELMFDGADYRTNKTGELKIIQELQWAIDSEEQKTAIAHMHRALEIINQYDDEHGGEQHVSTLIEVFIPFQNSKLPLDQFDFCIYDTPGSDSNHREHLEVLKDSLQGQTNGLPIFVTTPDEMDKEKNNEIIDIIEKMGEALDQTATIVVVNKSDEKSGKVLEEKKTKGNELRITKWHSSRVFFVSSIMGLGSKLEKNLSMENWLDEQYAYIYDEKKSRFLNPQGRFYMQLYKYNFLMEGRMKQILEEADKITEESELVWMNSGIMAVEEEIGIFARKYALYNKCIQARQYLEKAIELVEQKSEAVKDKVTNTKSQIEKRMEKKSKYLIDQLDKKGNAKASEIITGYINGMDKETDFEDSGLEELIEEIWKKIKENKERQKRIDAIEKEMDELGEAFSKYVNKEIGEWSKKYWKDAEQEYKKECCEIVFNSLALTSEQKQFLRSYVMEAKGIETEAISINMRLLHIISDRRIIFFKIGEKFNLKKCKKEFVNAAKHSISDMNHDATTQNNGKFNMWRKKLKQGLESRITSFNPNLADLAEKLNVCEKELERLNEQEKLLSESKADLEELLDFYEEE